MEQTIRSSKIRERGEGTQYVSDLPKKMKTSFFCFAALDVQY